MTDDNGRNSIKSRQAEDEVLAGRLVPSITNVIGTLNKPYLFGWTAKMVATEAVRIAKDWPQRISDSPAAAVEYLKGAADRDRDAAAVQGDRVHNACEAIARGLPCPELNPQEMLHVDSWKAWLDRWQPEFTHLEATVFGEAGGLGYAGTTDFIARINGLTVVGDYKTTRSGIHDEVALQLSAVAHADELSPDNASLAPMVSVDAGLVVHLSPEGYQAAPVVLDGQVWDTSCSLREAWDFGNLHGVLRDGTKAVGRVLSGPDALVASRPALRLAG